MAGFDFGSFLGNLTSSLQGATQSSDQAFGAYGDLLGSASTNALNLGSAGASAAEAQQAQNTADTLKMKALNHAQAMAQMIQG